MLRVAESYLRPLAAKINGFGMTMSHNDINVLHGSPVFATLVEGNASSVSYEVMGHLYIKSYFLANNIYL
jgi:hypothetical protein